MITQDAFISRVTAALGHPGPSKRRGREFFYPGRSENTGKVLNRIQERSSVDRLELLNTLVEQGKSLNLHVIAKKDIPAAAAAIAKLVDDESPEWNGPKSVAAWRHPLIDALDMAPLLSAQEVTYFTAIQTSEALEITEDVAFRRRLSTAFVGITTADYCLADTATLVLKTRPARARAVSLLPTIHVVVIELAQVIRNLEELFVLLKTGSNKPSYGLENCLTLITGPSKTADIELTMVHGAHGPRDLYLYIIAPELFE